AGVGGVPLTPERARLVKMHPWGLAAAGETPLLLGEPLDGRYVNVEPFSLRLNPGESGTVTLFAREFGQPLGALELPIGFDYQQFEPANSPPNAIRFPKTVTTESSGQVAITVSAAAPRPLPDRRSFIGSQVYFLGGPWEAWGQISAGSQAAISVLVFNDAPPMDNPTWADVQPVLNQYAVIYPGMARRLDLSSYQAVSSHSAEVLAAI